MKDQLTKEERVRLESLSQAVVSSIHNPATNNTAIIVERARTFEKYIKGSKVAKNG